MGFVTIFPMLLLLDVKALWLIIWVSFMLFFHEFNEVLPPAKEIEQRPKFFMVLALHGDFGFPCCTQFYLYSFHPFACVK